MLPHPDLEFIIMLIDLNQQVKNAQYRKYVILSEASAESKNLRT